MNGLYDAKLDHAPVLAITGVQATTQLGTAFQQEVHLDGNDGNHHVLGTCRMGTDPETSVVGPDCRSHDLPNLWICDGSVFPTVGAVNPSLTIQAVATRTARILLAA